LRLPGKQVKAGHLIHVYNIHIRERNKVMYKLLLVVLTLALGLWVLRQLLPDIQRYLRIRSM
jgi:hypothetical protein